MTAFQFPHLPPKGDWTPAETAFMHWWNTGRPETVAPDAPDMLCWIHAFNAGYFGNAFCPLDYPTNSTQYRAAFNGGQDARSKP